MFNKNSGLVKVWISLIMAGTYKKEQVPKLDNLKDVVYLILEEVAQ
ncbi:hypothetical protein [Clostridium tetani]|nr:hypothetical protein [Clostridium tetani]